MLNYESLAERHDPWQLDPDNLVAADVAWAAFGLPVYPTRDGTGRPCLAAGDNGGGHKQATLDLDVIVERREAFPTATGSYAALPPGIVSLDIDCHTGDGFAEAAALERDIGPLPLDTVIMLTPRAGAHLLYRVDADTHDDRWTQYAAGCAQVELGRWNTPLPPTRRADGDYRLVSAVRTVDDLPVLPDRWVRLFRTPPRLANPYAKPRVGGNRLQSQLLDEVRQAGEGTRNATLFQKSCVAIQYKVFDADLFCDAARDTGLSDREISDVLRSAERKVEPIGHRTP